MTSRPVDLDSPSAPAVSPPEDEPWLTYGQCRKRGWLALLAIAAGVVGITAILGALDADRLVSAHFYRPGIGWYLAHREPWQWLYDYGPLPGIGVAVAGFIAWLASWVRPKLARWRPYLLLVVLTMVIGPGLLVNAILKPYWGQPRPAECIEFGGTSPYRPVYRPGGPGAGRAFPCGHCSVGFALASLYFLWRRSRRLAVIGGTAGVALGILLSATRIVQGGHFLTDTIWSLAIGLFVATALYYLVLKIPAGGWKPPPPPAEKTP